MTHELTLDPAELSPLLEEQNSGRLTTQVADCLAARLRPRSTGVALEAEHSGVTLREPWAPRPSPRRRLEHCAPMLAPGLSSLLWPVFLADRSLPCGGEGDHNE